MLNQLHQIRRQISLKRYKDFFFRCNGLTNKYLVSILIISRTLGSIYTIFFLFLFFVYIQC